MTSPRGARIDLAHAARVLLAWVGILATAATGAAARQSRTPSAEDAAFWTRTWIELERADLDPRRSDSSRWLRRMSQLNDAARERRIVALSRADADDLFRTRLLQWHIDRLERFAGPALEAPRPGFAWLEREGWFGARALEPGPERTQAMLRALDEPAAVDRAQRRATAANQIDLELAVGNPSGAFDVARRLDAEEPTAARLARAAWAAAQAGRSGEVEPVLAARIQSAANDADETALRVARARLALARDDAAAARIDLGAALVLGSAEAAAAVADLALRQAEPERARVVLRAFLDDPALDGRGRATWALAHLDRAPGIRPIRPETAGSVPVR